MDEEWTNERNTHRRQCRGSPHAIRRVSIPKPGTNQTRPLGIPTVRDRIVQAAIVHAIESIFEQTFAEHSYGFRPGRGCKDALRRVEQFLREGYVHVVDADLKGSFDTIPHGRLMTRLKAKISDGRLLGLIESFLKAEVMDGLEHWTPEAGAPQGAVLSPLLSNVYLDELDQLMVTHGIEMVRYADDFVILCRSAADAERALELVRTWVSANGLTLHPEKTRIVDSRTNHFDFLGYSFRGQSHWPRQKSIQSILTEVKPSTGEPCAGNPPARFGGRGARTQSGLPTPIFWGGDACFIKAPRRKPGGMPRSMRVDVGPRCRWAWQAASLLLAQGGFYWRAVAGGFRGQDARGHFPGCPGHSQYPLATCR
jgi:group II intron reverse transcriptase/maturase